MSSEGNHILDTVVLLYFLLAGEEDLLLCLLGHPLQVPFAVYDPEDRDLPASALRHPDYLSEMRQALKYYEWAASGGGDAKFVTNVQRVDSLYEEGGLITVAMTTQEQALAAKLESSEVADYGLRVPLGPGEAACVAISFTRGWTIVTDDTDAFRALDVLRGGRNYGYERIRRLLARAADQNLITREDANDIHAEMRSCGFWDTGRPFS